MKVVRWLTAVAGIATLLSVQAQDRALGAVGNAEVILYRFPGVFDSGGAVREWQQYFIARISVVYRKPSELWCEINSPAWWPTLLSPSIISRP